MKWVGCYQGRLSKFVRFYSLKGGGNKRGARATSSLRNSDEVSSFGDNSSRNVNSLSASESSGDSSSFSEIKKPSWSEDLSIARGVLRVKARMEKESKNRSSSATVSSSSGAPYFPRTSSSSSSAQVVAAAEAALRESSAQKGSISPELIMELAVEYANCQPPQIAKLAMLTSFAEHRGYGSTELYTCIAQAMIKLRKLDSLIDLASQPHLRVDCVSVLCNTALSYLAQQKPPSWERVGKVVKLLELKHVPFSCDSVESLIKLCGYVAPPAFAIARDLVERLEESGIQPSSKVLTELITLYANSHPPAWDEMDKAVKKLVEVEGAAASAAAAAAAATSSTSSSAAGAAAAVEEGEEEEEEGEEGEEEVEEEGEEEGELSIEEIIQRSTLETTTTEAAAQIESEADRVDIPASANSMGDRVVEEEENDNIPEKCAIPTIAAETVMRKEVEKNSSSESEDSSQTSIESNNNANEEEGNTNNKKRESNSKLRRRQRRKGLFSKRNLQGVRVITAQSFINETQRKKEQEFRESEIFLKAEEILDGKDDEQGLEWDKFVFDDKKTTTEVPILQESSSKSSDDNNNTNNNTIEENEIKEADPTAIIATAAEIDESPISNNNDPEEKEEEKEEEIVEDQGQKTDAAISEEELELEQILKTEDDDGDDNPARSSSEVADFIYGMDLDAYLDQTEKKGSKAKKKKISKKEKKKAMAVAMRKRYSQMKRSKKDGDGKGSGFLSDEKRQHQQQHHQHQQHHHQQQLQQQQQEEQENERDPFIVGLSRLPPSLNLLLLETYSSASPPRIDLAAQHFEALGKDAKIEHYDTMLNLYLNVNPPRLVEAKALAKKGVRSLGGKAAFIFKEVQFAERERNRERQKELYALAEHFRSSELNMHSCNFNRHTSSSIGGSGSSSSSSSGYGGIFTGWVNKVFRRFLSNKEQ